MGHPPRKIPHVDSTCGAPTAKNPKSSRKENKKRKSELRFGVGFVLGWACSVGVVGCSARVVGCRAGLAGRCAGPSRGFAIIAREITAARADLVVFVLRNFDANFVITAVEGVIGGIVCHGILVAEFVADVLKRLIEIVHLIGEKSTPTGFIR